MQSAACSDVGGRQSRLAEAPRPMTGCIKNPRRRAAPCFARLPPQHTICQSGQSKQALIAKADASLKHLACYEVLWGAL